MENKYYKSRLVQTALILLVGLAFLTLGFYYQYYMSNGFRPGAAIAGIAVAGATQEETGELLNRQFDRIDVMPVTFIYDGDEDRTTLGTLIKPLNMEVEITSAWTADRSQSWYDIVANLVLQRTVNYPVPLEYDSVATDDLLRKWNDKWSVPFHDAVLEMDKSKGLIVSPGQAGMTVNQSETFKVLPTELKYIPDSISGTIVMEKQEPKIDEETLRHMGEIVKFSTKYNVNEINRTHNLTKAANIINGSIISPGEVFSFNQTVGRRTMETGYKDAMVIVNGRFEPGLGGGICQVSSTLYNACLLAGLEIVERHYHNLTVAYVPLGQDATVSYGTQDFKFKNNTTAPIYVRAVSAGGYLNVNIYGDTSFKQNIKISNVIDQSTPFQSVTLRDDNLQPGESKLDHKGQNGYVVRSFRIYYDQAGEQIKSESLGRSVYQALNETVLEGAPLEDEPAPTEPTGDEKMQKPIDGEKEDNTNPLPSELPESGATAETETNETETNVNANPHI